MNNASYVDIIQRLMTATSSKTESALASAIGISHQAVYSARKKESVPAAWIFEVSQRHGISADWLLFGIGSMRLDAGDRTQADQENSGEPSITPSANIDACSRCAKLEVQLDELRQDLRKEREKNEGLVTRLLRLTEENGDLRVQLARAAPDPAIANRKSA